MKITNYGWRIRLLADAGLAQAKAGRNGGYRLTRSPAEVSLLEVVEAAEGSFALERCILRGGPCYWQAVCAVHEAWSAAVQACRDSLRSTSLADLARADAQLATSNPTAPGALGRSNQRDRKSTRLNSSHVKISYAVFCLKKKKN